MLTSLLFIPLMSYNFLSMYDNNSSRLTYKSINYEVTDFLSLNDLDYNDYLTDTDYIEYNSTTRRLIIKKFGSIYTGGRIEQANYQSSSQQYLYTNSLYFQSNIYNMQLYFDNITQAQYDNIISNGIYYIDISLNSPTINYVFQNNSTLNFNYTYQTTYNLYFKGQKISGTRDYVYTKTHSLYYSLVNYDSESRAKILYKNNENLQPVEEYHAINCCKNRWYMEEYDYSQDIDNAYVRGYNKGYSTGYDEGYDEGTSDNPSYNFSWLKGTFSAINELFNIEIIPGLKLSYLLGIPLLLELIVFILRLLD